MTALPVPPRRERPPIHGIGRASSPGPADAAPRHQSVRARRPPRATRRHTETRRPTGCTPAPSGSEWPGFGLPVGAGRLRPSCRRAAPGGIPYAPRSSGWWQRGSSQLFGVPEALQASPKLAGRPSRRSRAWPSLSAGGDPRGRDGTAGRAPGPAAVPLAVPLAGPPRSSAARRARLPGAFAAPPGGCPAGPSTASPVPLPGRRGGSSQVRADGWCL